MPDEGRTLTHQQAIAFYNRFGAKQDWQAFYEAPATREMIAHASFEAAQKIFEFGCGTGAFAEQVLVHHLSPQAHYVAVESSTTMVRLAQARLAHQGARVTIRQTDGSLQFDEASGAYDRFVANYVVDLLSVADIWQLLAEARRLLSANGRLCVVSLTHGLTPLTRLVTWAWTHIHARDPRIVGGCRPLELRTYLPDTLWQIEYEQVVTAWGIPSQIVIASKRSNKAENL